MDLWYICHACKGTGLDNNPETTGGCAACGGAGKINQGVLIPELDDLKDKVNDVMDKCNDIFDKVNE